MKLFRDVIDEGGFLDLGFVGPQYTWSKHFATGHSVWEILDHGLANYEWSSNDFVHSDSQVLKKIERCGVELTKWSREKFGSVRKELDTKRRMLVDAEKKSLKSGMNNRVRELKLEIKALMDKENRMWLQRSKTLWALKETVIHGFISRLRKPDGQWSSTKEEVAGILINYYEDLYTSANPSQAEATLQSIKGSF